MKKNFLTLSAFCVLLSLSSCDSKSNSAQNNINAEQTTANGAFAVETMTVKDSTESSSVRFEYDIDFPTQGPEALTAVVKSEIFKALGDSTTTDYTAEQLQHVGKKYVTESAAEIKDLGLEEERTIYEVAGKIKLEDNNDKYLTYHVSDYNYAGGAHGMPRNFYTTINKTTNKVMDWDAIFPEDNRQDLEAIVMAAIVEQYYKGQTEQWNEIFAFNLPAQAPAFSENGLIFTYYPYEIDCYAAGMPKCTIPYNEVKTLMTEEAQALINE